MQLIVAHRPNADLRGRKCAVPDGFGVVQTGERLRIGGLCLRVKDALKGIGVVAGSYQPCFPVVNSIIAVFVVEPVAVFAQQKRVDQSVRRNGIAGSCCKLWRAGVVHFQQPLVKVADDGLGGGIRSGLRVQTFGIADQAGGKEIAGAVSIFFQHRDVASGAEKKNAGSGGSSGKSAEYFEK